MCDSTVTTNLTVSNAVTGSQTLTICIGNSIIVGTSTYDSTGVYTDVLPGAAMSGCDSTVTTNLTVDQCIGIQTYSFGNGINIYPNPTNGMFNIAISNANFKELIITVVDVQGRLIYNTIDKNIAPDYNKQINIEELAKGIYYIKLNNGTEVKVQKLVVQ